jgi:hypothetical protein
MKCVVDKEQVPAKPITPHANEQMEPHANPPLPRQRTIKGF